MVTGQVGLPRLEEIQARLSLSDIDGCQSQAQQALVVQTLLCPLEDTASVSPTIEGAWLGSLRTHC